MIGRTSFLQGIVVATGGLDIWDEPLPVPPAATTIRVQTATAIETLDVEQYLRGVVPVESPASWPPAALQAQAIVARTYALAKRSLSRAYDVQANDADQHYGGAAVERPASSAAVDATRGLMLRYNGGPASVFYSSCCGGHTADAAEVWGRSALPYLRGVADDVNCAASPDYRWRRLVPLDRVRGALAARLRGSPAAFRLGDAGASGRPRTITIDDDAGGTATISTTEFRARIGTDTVRSTWLQRVALEPTQAGANVAIEGCGRGHGVGLCQWGARGMALGGADVFRILAHFFPGTEVSGG